MIKRLKRGIVSTMNRVLKHPVWSNHVLQWLAVLVSCVFLWHSLPRP